MILVNKYNDKNNYMQFEVIYNHKSLCGGIHNFNTGRTDIKSNYRIKTKIKQELLKELLMSNDLHYNMHIIDRLSYDKKYRSIKWINE